MDQKVTNLKQLTEMMSDASRANDRNRKTMRVHGLSTREFGEIQARFQKYIADLHLPTTHVRVIPVLVCEVGIADSRLADAMTALIKDFTDSAPDFVGLPSVVVNPNKKPENWNNVQMGEELRDDSPR